MIKKTFPLSLFFLVLFIAIVNGLANEFFLYWRLPWLDIPMHFLGGLWVASAVLWVVFISDKFNLKRLRKTTSSIYLISMLSVLMVGGLWELFEFSLDTLVDFSEKNSAIDTISDLIFDILGGVTAAMYFLVKNKNESR